MSRYDDRFLADLARILRHGEQPLSQLIEELSDPLKRERLLHALEALRDMSSQQSARTRKVPKAAVREQTNDTKGPKNENREVPEIIDQLANRLQQSVSFRDRQVLVRIAETQGIRVAAKEPRVKIIGKIILHARQIPAHQLRELIRDLDVLDKDSPQSFQDLAGFITGETRNHPGSGQP